MEAISAGQLRAARALIGMSQEDLAKAAGVAVAEIAEAERSGRTPDSRVLVRLMAGLEGAGVEFIAAGEGGAGVRWKKTAPPPIPTEDLNASNDE